MSSLTYFSTFTGIGGLDWGLEEMGAKCVGFSEMKKTAIKVYLHHHPNRKNYGDITKMNFEDLPDFDVLTGGFPCQSFSTAGLQKGLADPRGQLVIYLYNLLVVKQPEFFVFENVKGIYHHDNGETFRKVFLLFSKAGYYVRALLLSSAFYGSPQVRNRVFFIGRRSQDFPKKHPEKQDDSKRFMHIRADERTQEQEWISEKKVQRLYEKDSASFIGNYDRIGTLTTSVASCGRNILITKQDNKWRLINVVEAERAQGFPDDYTNVGLSIAARWDLLGNAVNVNVSRYLFLDYLPKVWNI